MSSSVAPSNNTALHAKGRRFVYAAAAFAGLGSLQFYYSDIGMWLLAVFRKPLRAGSR